MNVPALLDYMRSNQIVNCVSFLAEPTVNYELKFPHKERDTMHSMALQSMVGALLPLDFWYDKPHVARTDYYRWIFSHQHYDLEPFC